MAHPVKESTDADARERDELHRLLIYLREVERKRIPDSVKARLSEQHYARVVWLNTPVRDRIQLSTPTSTPIPIPRSEALNVVSTEDA